MGCSQSAAWSMAELLDLLEILFGDDLGDRLVVVIRIKRHPAWDSTNLSSKNVSH